MAKRLSYFIRSEGPDRNAVKKALDWLLQVAPIRGFLAVPNLRDLDGVLAEELGAPAVTELKTKGKTILSGRELTAITRMKPIQTAENVSVVAFYPYGRFLDQLDTIREASAILVVPWSMQEIDHWVATWNAKELGGQKKASKIEHIKNKVVEEALWDITDRVNVPTGIEYQSDRDVVVHALLILKENGESFTPASIKAWLVSNGGWKATHAQEVAEMASEVLNGSRTRPVSSSWPADVIQIWRTRRTSTKA